MTAFNNVLARLTGRPPSVSHAAEVLLHTRLATSVMDDLSRQLGQPCDLMGVHATRTGSLTIRLWATRPYVVKVPLQGTTEPRLRENARTLRTLHQATWMTPFLSARLPAVVLMGTASGYSYTVETAVPGKDGASILKTGGVADEMILSSERFLSTLQKASIEAGGHRQWEAHFDAAAKRVAVLAARAGCARTYARLVAELKAHFSARRVPAVFSHGNFWLGNALFDTTGNLTGVIDWDCADDGALPALDLIYLLVRSHGLARSLSFGEGLADWIEADSLPLLDDCLARHCLELSIPVELVVPLAYGSWIQHLDSHCRYETAKGTSARWLERNVRLVLERWERAGVPNLQRWQRER